jgi:hypothetical protein
MMDDKVQIHQGIVAVRAFLALAFRDWANL